MGIIQIGNLKIIAACFLFLIIATAASAENNRAGAITVSPFAGKFLFDKHADYDDDLMIGLGLGYNLTQNIAAELSWGRVDTDRLDNGGNEVDGTLDLYRLEALYHFTGLCPGGFVPFVAVGAGLYSLDSISGRSGRDNDIAGDYGAGFKYFLNPDVALRGDIRHLLNAKGSNQEYDSNWFYTFGLTLLFGGEKMAAAPAQTAAPAAPAPAPQAVAPAPAAPLDSDKDGVTDDLDKCPGTPAGVKVDKDGCPLDTDGDGVADYLDKCPNTPKGVKVDAQGCPAAEKARITREGTLDFGIIYFDTSKSAIKPKSRPVLQEVIDYMNKNPEVKLEVQGHTDSIGSDVFNQKLSDDRANAVQKYLIGKGIAADRLKARGFGEARPAASNETKEGRAQNRRIEFMHIQ
jgi:OmpA-OmpF porin, OOP family